MSVENFNAEWPPLFRVLCSPLSTDLERVRASTDALDLIEKSDLGSSSWILAAMINKCLEAGGWPADVQHFQDAVSIVGVQLATELQIAYEQLTSGAGDTDGLIQK